MQQDVRVSTRGLSKAFQLRRAKRVRGVATGGFAAVGDLFRRTLTSAAEPPPASADSLFWALDDVSFDLRQGEVLGVIGRNGAGKSTLLKLLARVLQPTRGRAMVRGRVVSMLELGIGFAPEMTVRENLQIHGRLAGIPGSRIQEREADVLEFAGLTEYRDDTLGSCPSGSAVHLGFSAMIHLGADIILADEVLAVGNSAFRRMCEERVRDAGRSGGAVIFVSHDMEAIRRICTRVIWLDRGRLVSDGLPDAVVDAYTTCLLEGRLLPPLTGDSLARSCRLLDVRLLNDGKQQVGAMQMAEAGFVDCLIRLERPDVAAMIVVELWQGRHLVLRTETPEPIRADRPAVFRAGFRIPAHFLNELFYQARCRVSVTPLTTDGEPIIVAEERFDFSVMNPRPDESVWRDWNWGRSGLIAPRLEWVLTRPDSGSAVHARSAHDER